MKECHTSNVASFELHGMRMTFHPRRNEDAVQPSKASDHTVPLEYQTQPVVSELTEADKDEMDLMDQQALYEAEEAQLMIDDPKGFESVQISRHIERTRLNNENSHT